MLERLGDYVHRGVVLPAGYSLEDMYNERHALYERYADITIDVANGDIASTLEVIRASVAET